MSLIFKHDTKQFGWNLLVWSCKQGQNSIYHCVWALEGGYLGFCLVLLFWLGVYCLIHLVLFSWTHLMLCCPLLCNFPTLSCLVIFLPWLCAAYQWSVHPKLEFIFSHFYYKQIKHLYTESKKLIPLILDRPPFFSFFFLMRWSLCAMKLFHFCQGSIMKYYIKD